MSDNKYEQILANQHFLLNFGNQIGPLAEVEQVFWTAATLVGEYFKANRCYFAEFDTQDPLLIVHRNYCDKLESLEQVYPLSVLKSELVEELEQGRPVVLQTGETAAAADLLISSQDPTPPGYTLAVPLLKENKLAMLGVIQTLQVSYYNQSEAEIVLFQAVLERTWLAVCNARLYQQARRLAVIEERTRVARELHDSLAQALYGVQLNLNTALALLTRNPQSEEIPRQLRQSLLQIEGTNNELRALIFDLRPEALQSAGLVQALTNFIVTLRTHHNFEVISQLGAEPNVALVVKEALYWIARQALQNIVSHAQATKVGVELECTSEHISLKISDNGRGFEVDQSYPGHWGLRFIRSRAAEVGGECEIKSSPGQGSSIEVLLPLAEAQSRISLDSRLRVSKDSFAIKFAKLNQRIQTLQEQTSSNADLQSGLLEQAFYELNTVLEELQVTEDSLTQRYSELEITYQDLDMRKQHYQELFEMAPIGYLVTNSFGVIAEANDKACQLLNSVKAFIIDKPLRSFIARSEQAKLDNWIGQLRNCEQDQVEAEWEIWLQPYKNKPLLATLKIAPVFDRKHNLQGFRWLLR